MLAMLFSAPAFAESTSRQSTVYAKDGIEFVLPAGWAVTEDRALQYVRCVNIEINSGQGPLFAVSVEIFPAKQEMSLKQFANHTVRESNKRSDFFKFTIAERRPVKIEHGFDIQTIVIAARSIDAQQFSSKVKTLRKRIDGRTVFFSGASELGEHAKFDEEVLSLARSFRFLPEN